MNIVKCDCCDRDITHSSRMLTIGTKDGQSLRILNRLKPEDHPGLVSMGAHSDIHFCHIICVMKFFGFEDNYKTIEP